MIQQLTSFWCACRPGAALEAGRIFSVARQRGCAGQKHIVFRLTVNQLSPLRALRKVILERVLPVARLDGRDGRVVDLLLFFGHRVRVMYRAVCVVLRWLRRDEGNGPIFMSDCFWGGALSSPGELQAKD